MSTDRNDHIIEFMNHLHIKIADSGYAEVGSDWNCSRVCSPYSRLYLIRSGEGTITYGIKQLLLQPFHVYLIPAGLTFDYACQGHLRQLYFHVNVMAADGYDLLSRLDHCYACQTTRQEVEDALSCYRGRRLGDAVKLQQVVHQHLAYFIAQSRLGEQAWKTYSPFLHRLYPLVRQAIGSKTTIKDLAGQLAMSESALTKRFKAETGITLGQYMDQLLFQSAQQLLLATDDTICQIAEQLGFCDQFYFSRYFRQHQHEAPSQYRKRLRVPF
jgi:AraC-like DNA-binding protein